MISFLVKGLVNFEFHKKIAGYSPKNNFVIFDVKMRVSSILLIEKLI
jgi:hypothetical protein